MAAQPSFRKINLIPEDEFEKSIVGKSLKWALTAGKSIVIVTEFVVILAFLSRFKLDRDLNDLNEIIAQKVVVVDSFSATEEVMRKLQARAKVVQTVDGLTVNFNKRWGEIVATTPRDMVFESVDVSRDAILLKGVSGSESGFAALLSGLKRLEGVSSVTINDIGFDVRKGGVVFTVSAKLAQAGSGSQTENE